MAAVLSKVEEITGILRTEILRGQYRAGERLPSERDLSARFDANRGAVREVFKKLEQLGIIEVTPGGVRVLPVEEATLEVLGFLLDLGEIQRPELISQMLDVLGAMMALSARSAISAASDEEIAAIAAIINYLIDSTGGDEAVHHENWMELGEKFIGIHNNLVLRLVGNGLRTQFISNLNNPESKPVIDQNSVRKTLEDFREAVLMKDAVTASNAVIKHFEILKAGLLGCTVPVSVQSGDQQRAEHA